MSHKMLSCVWLPAVRRTRKTENVTPTVRRRWWKCSCVIHLQHSTCNCPPRRAFFLTFLSCLYWPLRENPQLELQPVIVLYCRWQKLKRLFFVPLTLKCLSVLKSVFSRAEGVTMSLGWWPSPRHGSCCTVRWWRRRPRLCGSSRQTPLAARAAKKQTKTSCGT